MQKNAKGVGFFRHKPSGCFWYRIKHPQEALTDHGVPSVLINLNEDVVTDNLQSFQFYGAYPFRADKVFEYLKSEGKKIVYDADDALDWIDPSNPFYYTVKKDLGSVSEALNYADEITVSTPEMKKYMEGKTDKKVTVIPNCYDPKEWTYTRPKREGFRIGFSGSPTHVGDLVKVLPAIRNIQKKYPQVVFTIQGFGTEEYGEWFKNYRYVATEEGIKDLYLMDKLLADIKFEWVPFVDFSSHPSTLTNMSFDIGLCPLKDTPFNRCRSACKAMEYELSGALALASDLPTYQEDLSSILVSDDRWEQIIEFYIKNPDVLLKTHHEHLVWLKENRDINTKIDLLKSVYVI